MTFGFLLPQIFFTQKDFSMVFKKLHHLILLIDGSYADQVPIIASFLKGLPNLRRLIIRLWTEIP